jgi:molybdopterin synthase catalytic subunit
VFKITPSPLSLDEAYAAVRRDDCGGICLFVGAVRDRHDGKAVASISYSAFAELAEKEFARMAGEARARWGIAALYVAHRTGKLEIGDASVIVAASAAHRAEAFEACRYAIEELKKRAPVWKEEFYEAGGKAWIST